jgi:hypothetical protein
VKQFHELSAAKHQVDRIDAAIAGTLQPDPFEISGQGKLATRDLLAGIQELRDLNVEDKQIERLLKDEPISAADRAWVESYERELLGSQDFVKRFLSGDLAARRELTVAKLHKLRPVAGESAK